MKTAQRWRDLSGSKFGHLTILRQAEKTEEPCDKYKYDGCRWWIARCDCGIEKAFNTKRLNAGSTKSCGCMSGTKKPFGMAAKWQIYKLNQIRARKRGKEFKLTFDQFVSITSEPCTYCGTEWSSLGPTHPRFHGGYRHNGIDRIDSSKGYIPGNCASCCGPCNSAKGTKTVDQFKEWVARVFRHMKISEK